MEYAPLCKLKVGGFTTLSKVPVGITFLDINEFGPGTAEVYNNTNQRFDIYDINNYNLMGVTCGRELVDECEPVI